MFVFFHLGIISIYKYVFIINLIPIKFKIHHTTVNLYVIYRKWKIYNEHKYFSNVSGWKIYTLAVDKMYGWLADVYIQFHTDQIFVSAQSCFKKMNSYTCTVVGW